MRVAAWEIFADIPLVCIIFAKIFTKTKKLGDFRENEKMRNVREIKKFHRQRKFVKI